MSPSSSASWSNPSANNKQEEEAIPILHAVVSSAAAAADYQSTDQGTISSPVALVDPQVVSIDDPDDSLVLFLTRDSGNEQGAVPNSTDNDNDNDNDGDENNSNKDDSHNSRFRDWPSMVIFWIQILLVVLVGYFYAGEGWDHALAFDWKIVEEQIAQADDVTPEDYAKFQKGLALADEYFHRYPERMFKYLFLPTSILSYLVSLLLLLGVVKPFPKVCVRASLYGTMTTTVVLAITFVIENPGLVSLFLAVLVVGGVWYYVQLVWPMIPFASVNIKVALTAIRDNAGVLLVAILLFETCIFWVFGWFYVTFGLLFYEAYQCDAHVSVNITTATSDSARFLSSTNNTGATDDECDNEAGLCLLLLLVSLFWTISVILNTSQVTVSGVMATWCFDKEAASGCCSMAVWGSFYRALTFSFGSICFGSFFQGMVSAIRGVIKDAKRRRENHDGCEGCCALCYCVLECAAGTLNDVIEYFNQWAYVFVGIYGYSYLESGRKAMELFRAKGWMSITTERLASHMLAFTTCIIGILTGVLAVIVERIVNAACRENDDKDVISFVYGPVSNFWAVCFFQGFFLGVVLSSVLMGVVRGAVNTLIICWADSPSLLEANHPDLTKEMIEAWAMSFPETMIHTTAQARPVMDL